MPVAVESYAPLGQISLNVIVGNAQPGHVLVYLGDELKADKWNRLDALELGAAGALKGKVLTISCTVLDVQSQTNLTNVDMKLTDTAGVGVTIARDEHAKPNTPVNYFYVVRFT